MFAGKRVGLCSVVALVVVIVLSHCTSEAVNPSQGVGTPSGYPAVMQILSGDKQSGVVGTQLAAPLVVRVLDLTQSPVQGQLINFRVPSETLAFIRFSLEFSSAQPPHLAERWSKRSVQGLHARRLIYVSLPRPRSHSGYL